jgi:hypothetical protein
MPKQVGTVELLKVRIYPIDPRNHAGDRTEMIVQPGTYPLYCDHGVSLLDDDWRRQHSRLSRDR